MVHFERWIQFAPAQQLGNIGSEITRARIREEENDMNGRNQALLVALELIDLSLDDARWNSGVKEIARLREVVADWYADTHVYNIPRKKIEEYCVSFLLAQYRH